MDSYKYISEVKKDLAHHLNIRTHENTRFNIKVVVGETGFIHGAREVVKVIIKKVNDLNRDDIIITQIDDTEYKDNHTVVIVDILDGDSKVYKNITVDTINKVFENII